MTDIAIPVETTTARLDTSKAPRLSAIARSAGMRAARTFSQAFLAVLTAGPVLHLNAGVVKAGATAGLAAVLTLAQRLLDETPLPTLPAG